MEEHPIIICNKVAALWGKVEDRHLACVVIDNKRKVYALTQEEYDSQLLRKEPELYSLYLKKNLEKRYPGRASHSSKIDFESLNLVLIWDYDSLPVQLCLRILSRKFYAVLEEIKSRAVSIENRMDPASVLECVKALVDFSGEVYYEVVAAPFEAKHILEVSCADGFEVRYTQVLKMVYPFF